MNAVVLGSADCLAADIRALLDLAPLAWTVVVVNEAGVHYTGRIHHWVTMHWEKLDWWCGMRTGNADYTPYLAPVCEGSSGAAAMVYARDVLRASRIVLCGIPIDERPHVGRPGNWKASGSHQPWWEANAAGLGNVRSMSGWTKDLLGAPTREWLMSGGGDDAA